MQGKFLVSEENICMSTTPLCNIDLRGRLGASLTRYRIKCWDRIKWCTFNFYYLQKMSDKCFKKCVNKPGTSLDSSEQVQAYANNFNKFNSYIAQNKKEVICQ